jgi:hypothetical protein
MQLSILVFVMNRSLISYAKTYHSFLESYAFNVYFLHLLGVVSGYVYLFYVHLKAGRV